MKKILIIFGTRPEAIKLAPLIIQLKKSRLFQAYACFTGQHREMVKNILYLFNIDVDYDLRIMKKGQDLFDITSASIIKLKKILEELNPDLLIVQGDTTTAFTASLAAFYKRIKIAHVEAGLRSNNIYQPYPEEVNRKFISILAGLHFAPTKIAAENLLKEGISKSNIFVTGNTVIDAMKEIEKRLSRKEIKSGIEKKLKKHLPGKIFAKKFILITLHRREKFGEEFEKVLNLIKNIASESEYNFVYPVHLNPNVQAPVKKILKDTENIFLLPPMDYLEFIFLMSESYFIITDSGGVQEECYVFKKPVIVMRNVTEREEAIKAGYAFLTGTDEDKIKKTFTRVDKKLKQDYNFFTSPNPFGDGNAAKRIVERIEKIFI